ncbi:MAG: hypothetical protein ABI425_04335 [Patescibacteria group bacterium]
MEDQREKSTSDLFDRDDAGIFLPTIKNKEIINRLIKKHNRNIEKVKEELGNELWLEYVRSTTLDPENGKISYLTQEAATKGIQRQRVITEMNDVYSPKPISNPVHPTVQPKTEFNYWSWAIIVGFITFVCIWIYALFTWGLLLGLLVGWIPALIGGFVVGLVWPVAVLIVVVLIVLIIYNSG